VTHEQAVSSVGNETGRSAAAPRSRYRTRDISR
jgi:hypothetical protein